MDNKFNIGDRVILDYGGGYGVISEVTDWKYSPKTGYEYEIENRPSRYWKEERIGLIEKKED